MGVSRLGTEVSLDMNSILFGRGVRGIIEGDSVPDEFIPRLVDLHAQGRFPFDQLVTPFTIRRDPEGRRRLRGRPRGESRAADELRRSSEATLGEMLRSSAERHGDKPIVVCVDRTVAARELDELASRLAVRTRRARHRARRSCHPLDGERLALDGRLLRRAAARGVVVPCNILLTADEVGFIVDDSGSTAMIAAQDRIASHRKPPCPAARRRQACDRRRTGSTRIVARTRPTRRGCLPLRPASARQPGDDRVHVRHDRPAERRRAHARVGPDQHRDDSLMHGRCSRHRRLGAAAARTSTATS